MNDARNTAPSPTASTQGNVDQIRDIIFGPQMRDYEARFSAIATSVENGAASVRKDLEARFQALTEKGAKNSEFLAAELKAERAERIELGRRLTVELREIAKEMERGIRAAEANAERLHKEALKVAQEHADEARAEARAQYDELAERISASLGSIERSKVSREEMAAVLSEMASRLLAGPKPGDKK